MVGKLTFHTDDLHIVNAIILQHFFSNVLAGKAIA